MTGVRTPSGAPAQEAERPERGLPKSVHFSMATSVHFSMTIDRPYGSGGPRLFLAPTRRVPLRQHAQVEQGVWEAKLNGNRDRDQRNLRKLKSWAGERSRFGSAN